MNSPVIEQPASQAEIAATPLWHLYDYDLAHSTFTLTRIEEQLYRQASFLDSRLSEHRCPSVRYELKHLADMFPRLGESRRPMGFIFHVGHCGSTLLSRALSTVEGFLPFREPLTLRKLSADHRELDTPFSPLASDDWSALLTTVIDSLARQFRPGQVNVVKATSTGNNLIAPILEEDHRCRAVLLYIPLENYLANMLGKQKDGGDLVSQARTRMTDWLAISAQADLSLHELNTPQLAVLSWLTSMQFMSSARQRFGDRTLWLDFEDLIARPVIELPRIAGFLGLADEGERIAANFSAVASGYSKRPEKRFTPQTRAQLLQRARDAHAVEIGDGLAWAGHLIRSTDSLQALGEFLR